MKTYSMDKKKKKGITESSSSSRLTSDLRESMDRRYSPIVTSRELRQRCSSGTTYIPAIQQQAKDKSLIIESELRRRPNYDPILIDQNADP